jgi:DNA topoisomerase IB
VEVKKVLSRIEKAVDVKFVYSSNTINANQKVSLNANNEKLSEVLMQLLTPLDITYEVVGSRILLRKNKTADNAFVMVLLPRQGQLCLSKRWQEG